MKKNGDNMHNTDAVMNASPDDLPSNGEYGIVNGCFVKYEWVENKAGGHTVKTKKLCNFIVDLLTDTKIDDGISQERWYEGEIIQNGNRMPFRDEARKFVTSTDHARVLVTAGGSVLVFNARDLQDIRHAMQATSNPVRKNIRQTFGLLDAYTYETPSVVIDRDGVKNTPSKDIDLSGKGNAKCLDMHVLSDDEFNEVGVHIRDDLLNLHSRYVIDLLVGHTFLAPFGTEIIENNGWSGEHIGLFLVGTTGNGKSFDAVMFQWFFGEFRGDGAITSWTATPNAIGVTGYYFKDAIYLVDDFKLSHFRGNPARYAGAIGIMQNYTDGTARDRLTSDIKIREGQPIRGSLIITGEDFPHNEASIEGRYHIIHVSGGSNEAIGRKCIRNREHYSGFMARYIAWMFKRDEYASYIVDRIDVYREMFMNGRENAININRLSQSFAYNLVGYEMFCNFMQDCEFITKKKERSMIETHKTNLINNIDCAVDGVRSATAGAMYLELLSDLISSGRLKIHDWSDTHTVRDTNSNPRDDDFVEESLPIEDLPFCTGFDVDYADEYLYIIPNIAFTEVCRMASSQGMPFNHTQSGTAKELIATGKMAEGKDGKSATVKWYQSKSRRVWKILKTAIQYEFREKQTQTNF